MVGSIVEANVARAGGFRELDVTTMQRFINSHHEELARRHEVEITVFSLVAHVVARVLAENPDVNSRWAGKHLIRFQDVNIGFATPGPDEFNLLVVPRTDTLSAVELASAIKGLYSGSASPQGGPAATFTLVDNSLYGSVLSRPFVRPGQAMTIHLESVIRRPIVRGEVIQIGYITYLCSGFDHRVLDGSRSAAFTSAVEEAVSTWTQATAGLEP